MLPNHCPFIKRNAFWGFLSPFAWSDGFQFCQYWWNGNSFRSWANTSSNALECSFIHDSDGLWTNKTPFFSRKQRRFVNRCCYLTVVFFNAFVFWHSAKYYLFYYKENYLITNYLIRGMWHFRCLRCDTNRIMLRWEGMRKDTKEIN